MEDTMIQKIKSWLESHQKEYELLRYLVAGGLTTLLSMLISYGVCFILADRATLEGNFILWVIDSINRATPPQVSAANTISWIIAVLFAFWINRVMVFQVEGGSKAKSAQSLCSLPAATCSASCCLSRA